ncbi:hypothetical protein VTJ49DRAFT_2467 [Mycothermus thermophilus]|uniref:Uncharacterized protein n=1 Tax=Humicola insolens TaxID=85995 RepID=A0ABR3VAH6_HUMIN
MDRLKDSVNASWQHTKRTGHRAVQAAVSGARETLSSRPGAARASIDEGWEDEDGWELVDDDNVSSPGQCPTNHRRISEPVLFEQVPVVGGGGNTFSDDMQLKPKARAASDPATARPLLPSSTSAVTTAAATSTTSKPLTPAEPPPFTHIPMRARRLVIPSTAPTSSSSSSAPPMPPTPGVSDNPYGQLNEQPVDDEEEPMRYHRAGRRLKDRIAAVKRAHRGAELLQREQHRGDNTKNDKEGDEENEGREAEYHPIKGQESPG